MTTPTPHRSTSIHFHNDTLAVTGDGDLANDISLPIMAFIVGLLRAGLDSQEAARIGQESLDQGFDLTITEDEKGFVFDAGDGVAVAGPALAAYFLATEIHAGRIKAPE